jgi:integrase
MPHLMHDIEQKSAGRVSTKHRSLTQSEYNALMRHLSWISEPLHNDTEFGYASNIRIHAEIVLMNQAGLRVGEIPTIEIGDITINERSGSIIVRTGKGDKERTVQLNLLARQALTAWLQVNINAYPTDKLFGLRTTRSIQRDVEDIASAINIPDLTCHWLRYDLAKRLERNNTPLEAIRDILGHTTIEQTKRYLRSSAEDIQSALESVM